MKSIGDCGFRIADSARRGRVIRNPKSAIRNLVILVGIALLLPACRIGSGFDTAEKRRNLEWNEPIQVTQPEVTEPTPEVVATAKATPPIIYLLVAG